VAETLILAEQVGDQAASEQTGASVSAIREWRIKARRDLRAARAEYLASGGMLPDADTDAPDWRTQRELEANRAGLDARIVRDRAVQAMLDGNDRLVRAGAALYCALVDRAQLLTAGARPVATTPEERLEQERRILRRGRRKAEQRGDTRAVELFDAWLGGAAS
jgi:hypothetical protein